MQLTRPKYGQRVIELAKLRLIPTRLLGWCCMLSGYSNPNLYTPGHPPHPRLQQHHHLKSCPASLSSSSIQHKTNTTVSLSAAKANISWSTLIILFLCICHRGVAQLSALLTMTSFTLFTKYYYLCYLLVLSLHLLICNFK